jgi:hypothetical protein
MSDRLSEQEVEKIVEKKFGERGFLSSRTKIGLLLGILAFAAILPVLGDINIKDSGDLILRGDTGLDVQGSTIDNVGAPQDSGDAVNMTWVEDNDEVIEDKNAATFCSGEKYLNGEGECVSPESRSQVNYYQNSDSCGTSECTASASVSCGTNGQIVGIKKKQNQLNPTYSNLEINQVNAIYSEDDKYSASVSKTGNQFSAGANVKIKIACLQFNHIQSVLLDNYEAKGLIDGSEDTVDKVLITAEGSDETGSYNLNFDWRIKEYYDGVTSLSKIEIFKTNDGSSNPIFSKTIPESEEESYLAESRSGSESISINLGEDQGIRLRLHVENNYDHDANFAEFIDGYLEYTG